MHPYRTHNNNDLRITDQTDRVKLSGWVHAKRNHGGLLFVDLRDHHGITQLVFFPDVDCFLAAEECRLESVITVVGIVVARSQETINHKIDTGEIEVRVSEFHIQSSANVLPFSVAGSEKYPEELRLKHRYLDLRTEKAHTNITLRSKVISFLRKQMERQGFMEIQTPILTASSPEGARDFLVPSRMHQGKFYALPQAPQQYKQLLMVAGFDKYFQIAPCFRDESTRADRSLEFYQLDFEMSYATQEDVFAAIEPVLYETFYHFYPYSPNGVKYDPHHPKSPLVDDPPFVRIPYETAMLKYGTDKPDLRYPVEIIDMTEHFRDSAFTPFADAIAKGAVVRGIPGYNVGQSPRSYYKMLDGYITSEGAGGLAYINFAIEGGLKSPLIKFLGEEKVLEIFKNGASLNPEDALFFICDKPKQAATLAGKLRMKLAEGDPLFEKDAFKFCWITDFPMYERDEETGKIDFSHNPFSMPQGGMDALMQDPLTIKAYQYDIVCNGIELSSGAIRNHVPEIMLKAFSIAGYSNEAVEEQFSGMLNAFRYGAPPHGGSAPGIDRMVMMLADEPNIREVIPFPLNQRGDDLLMNSPVEITEARLRELGLAIRKPK